jgi:hypothetical protein
MSDLRLIRIDKGSELYSSCLPRAEFQLPASALGREYYRSIFGQDPAELSFGYAKGDRVVALVECDASHPGRLTRFGSPIELRVAEGVSLEDRRMIIRGVFGMLKQYGREHGLESALVRTNESSDGEGLFCTRLVVAGASPVPSIRSVVDLGQDDEALLSDLRKGHRQQVRWGEKNLELRFVSAEEGDYADFELFRELHAHVAGRVTRDVTSWKVAFQAVKEGKGDVVMSYFEGDLVGGTLTLVPSETAYYSTGAYRRELFKYPLSHYPLFVSFARARARGCTRFDVGEIWHDPATASSKECAIASFKRGFTSRSQTSLVWIVDLSRGDG